MINPDLAKRLQLYKVLKLTPNFWREVGVNVKKWIKKDMREGRLQTDTQYNYKSNQYKKYKSKFMNKLDGRKVKSVRGTSVQSNWTNSVNMLLTGQLIDGLSTIKTDTQSVTLKYADKDKMKLIGNPEYAKGLLTLSGENKEKVKKMVIRELEKSMKDWAKQKIVISV